MRVWMCCLQVNEAQRDCIPANLSELPGLLLSNNAADDGEEMTSESSHKSGNT